MFTGLRTFLVFERCCTWLACQHTATRCFHLAVCIVYDQAVPGNVAVTGCKDERGGGDLPLLPESPIWPRSVFSLWKEGERVAQSGSRKERKQEGYSTSGFWQTCCLFTDNAFSDWWQICQLRTGLHLLLIVQLFLFLFKSFSQRKTPVSLITLVMDLLLLYHGVGSRLSWSTLILINSHRAGVGLVH